MLLLYPERASSSSMPIDNLLTFRIDLFSFLPEIQIIAMAARARRRHRCIRGGAHPIFIIVLSAADGIKSLNISFFLPFSFFSLSPSQFGRTMGFPSIRAMLRRGGGGRFGGGGGGHPNAVIAGQTDATPFLTSAQGSVSPLEGGHVNRVGKDSFLHVFGGFKSVR